MASIRGGQEARAEHQNHCVYDVWSHRTCIYQTRIASLLMGGEERSDYLCDIHVYSMCMSVYCSGQSSLNRLRSHVLTKIRSRDA